MKSKAQIVEASIEDDEEKQEQELKESLILLKKKQQELDKKLRALCLINIKG